MKKVFLILLIGFLIIVKAISQGTYEKRKIVSISPLLYYQIRLKYEKSINSTNSLGLFWKVNWSNFTLINSDYVNVFKGTRIEPFVRWYETNSVLKGGYFQLFGILGIYKGNVEYGYNEHTCSGWLGDYTCYDDEFSEKRKVFTAGAGILYGCQCIIGNKKIYQLI
jgi:hypothetical protein